MSDTKKLDSCAAQLLYILFLNLTGKLIKKSFFYFGGQAESGKKRNLDFPSVQNVFIFVIYIILILICHGLVKLVKKILRRHRLDFPV